MVRKPAKPGIRVAADNHAIFYAESEAAARVAWTACEKKWKRRCAGVVRSLNEGGDELLTFFRFPKHSGRRSAPPTFVPQPPKDATPTSHSCGAERQGSG
jgi:transposase-like protein